MPLLAFSSNSSLYSRKFLGLIAVSEETDLPFLVYPQQSLSSHLGPTGGAVVEVVGVQ